MRNCGDMSAHVTEEALYCIEEITSKTIITSIDNLDIFLISTKLQNKFSFLALLQPYWSFLSLTLKNQTSLSLFQMKSFFS
jgi:hypothetical protein